jgi:fucose 4-O-acetylase-like acetyltransferase
MRDSSIDIMRFIGLAMIILAHVGPPNVLFQMRNFDVPLMVLVSGMAFGLSFKESESYLSYIWKRVKRLVIPVWIFLTGYFFVLLLFVHDTPDLNAYKIVTSYLLLGGIGYVWIIRVFVLVALVSPFIYRWHMNESSNKTYFFVIAFIFIAYEIVRYLTLPFIDNYVAKFLSEIFHYIIPYSLIFAIGLRIPSLHTRFVANISFVSLAVFITFGLGIYILTGAVLPTQQFKYPPSIYYFSYALLISSILWIFRKKIELLINKIKLKEIVLFCAQNSIWIYLWHIPVVRFFHANFVVKYLAAFGISTLLVLIQVWLINRIIENVQSTNLKRNLKTLFTG